MIANPTLTLPAHHTAKGFRNPGPPRASGFARLLRWRWQSWGRKRIPVSAQDFPLAPSRVPFLAKNRQQRSLTWIGHATLLLQFSGLNILTDPHFSPRASPVSWAGPKRVVPPAIALKQLPAIDVVLISHNHYDSLDLQTTLQLVRRPGGKQTRFFVPLGLKRWFLDLGITPHQVIEFDWWQKQVVGKLTVTATPAQHWSKRTLFDANSSLWAGWTVRSPHFNLYFAGDSGYGPHFKEIGKRLGPFDLAAIPIGAYEPRWFMRYGHINPAEALMAHLDVRAKQSVAIHWGTFRLSDEALTDPPKKLAAALATSGLDSDRFLVLRHGQTILLPDI